MCRHNVSESGLNETAQLGHENINIRCTNYTNAVRSLICSEVLSLFHTECHFMKLMADIAHSWQNHCAFSYYKKCYQ